MAEEAKDLTPAEPEVSGKSPSNLDEDLFDFAEESEPDEDRADDLSLGARNLSELVEASESQKPRAATSQAGPDAPQDGVVDPDEDLFGFDELFEPTDRTDTLPLQHSDLIPAPVAAATAAVKEEAPSPAEVDHEVEEEEPEPPPRAKAAPGSQAPRKATPPEADSAGFSEARHSASEALALAHAAREVLLDRSLPSASEPSDKGWNRRMVVSVAAAFLLVNASLIAVAIQLSHSMDRALNGVREDLTRSISMAQSSDVPIQVVLPPSALPQPVPAPAPATAQETELTDIATRELELAHGEIEQAAFAAARRRLYRLLANRDRLLISQEALAEAEFLVAESYLAEAKNRDPKETGR